jgi:hypothetical protein
MHEAGLNGPIPKRMVSKSPLGMFGLASLYVFAIFAKLTTPKQLTRSVSLYVQNSYYVVLCCFRGDTPKFGHTTKAEID